MLIRTIQTDTLFSSVYDLRSSMGYAAAETAASAIRAVLERKETANVIFAEHVLGFFSVPAGPRSLNKSLITGAFLFCSLRYQSNFSSKISFV